MSTVLSVSRSITVRPPRASSRLPIVELERMTVSTPRKRIAKALDKWPQDRDAVLTTTVGHAKSVLQLLAWEFCHAAAKTELANSFSSSEVVNNAFGYHLLTRNLLDWQPANLRLRDRGIFSRKDAARTSYAGRFGEAVTYLLMLQKGYVYWDHLPSLVERAINKAQITHDEQVRVAGYQEPIKTRSSSSKTARLCV